MVDCEKKYIEYGQAEHRFVIKTIYISIEISVLFRFFSPQIRQQNTENGTYWSAILH